MTSQSVMSVDGVEIPGKALEKRWCSSLQVSEATDENDLNLKEVSTCPIEKAVGEIDSRADEGMDQSLDGWWCKWVSNRAYMTKLVVARLAEFGDMVMLF